MRKPQKHSRQALHLFSFIIKYPEYPISSIFHGDTWLVKQYIDWFWFRTFNERSNKCLQMVYSWSINRPDNTVLLRKKSKTFSFSVSLFLCPLSERVVTVFMIVCLFLPVTRPVLVSSPVLWFGYTLTKEGVVSWFIWGLLTYVCHRTLKMNLCVHVRRGSAVCMRLTTCLIMRMV